MSGSWMHAILEVYEPDEGWPKIGAPADWIDQNLVGYCNGRLEDVIILTPLHKILWLKLKRGLFKLRWALIWRFQ